MSGFEVVGVLLALYPMLVSGIEMCRAIRSGRDVKDLVKEVCEEQLIFHDWIGHLLMPSVSEIEILGLLDPKSQAFGRWRDRRFHQILERTYGVGKAQFMLMTLKEIHDEMEGMGKDLEYLRKAHNNPNENRLRAVFGTWRRTREGSMLRERIVKVHKSNESLGRILTMSERRANVMPPRLLEQGLTSKFVLPRCHPRTIDLYHAIDAGFHCSCSRPHNTKFRLPRFTSRIVTTNTVPISAPVSNEPTFEVLFSTDTELSEDSHRVESPDSSKLLEGSPDEIASSQGAPSFGRQTSWDPSSSLLSEPSSSRDQLSLLDTNTTNSSLYARPLAPSSCRASISECPRDREDDIGNLCDVIRFTEKDTGTQLIPRSIGVLSAPNALKFDVRLDATHGRAGTMTSLEDIFLGDCCRLTRKHRIGLALRLSAAVLQLCSTPWIEKAWSWGDFSMTANFPLDAQQLEDTTMYIAQSFYSSNLLPDKRSEVQKGMLDLLSIIRGETALIRLGCALVELAFGKKLSAMTRSMPHRREDQPALDLAIACALLESGRLKDEEGKEYCDVVNACLKQQLRASDGISFKPLTTQNPAFHEDATQAIVAPLHKLWSDNWGVSTA